MKSPWASPEDGVKGLRKARLDHETAPGPKVNHYLRFEPII